MGGGIDGAGGTRRILAACACLACDATRRIVLQVSGDEIKRYKNLHHLVDLGTKMGDIALRW